MATKGPIPAKPGNRFLARLPDASRQSLMSLLQPLALPFEQVLYKNRGAMDYAYFPNGAVLSALAIMENGTAIEVATVGNEGLVGHTAAIGARLSPNKVIVQIANGGYRIEASVLRDEVAKN